MEILDSSYYESDENPYAKFIISSSMKREINRCLAKELNRIFKHEIDLKILFFRFLDENWRNGSVRPKREDLLLIPNLKYKNQSYAKYFGVYTKGSYIHTPKLIIENLKGAFPIIDPTQEIEPNSLKMTLELDDYDIESIKKISLRYIRKKGGHTISGFPFPVKVYSPGLDCELKVGFVEIQSKESKAIFISKVLEAVNQFNEANEQGEDSKGLIHNVLKIKSEKTNSDNLTFVVDLGSAGEEGLNVFFKAFEESLIEIDFVEVK